MRTGWEPLLFPRRWKRSTRGATASRLSRRAPSCAPPASRAPCSFSPRPGTTCSTATASSGSRQHWETAAPWPTGSPVARGGGAFHLEIDTGMGRSGVRWDEVEPLADLLDTPYLEGCYTQFHSAERNDGSAEQQLERFRLAVARLARRPALLPVATRAAALKGGSFAVD